MCADAAAARLTPTRTLSRAPANALTAPSIAATYNWEEWAAAIGSSRNATAMLVATSSVPRGSSASQLM